MRGPAKSTFGGCGSEALHEVRGACPPARAPREDRHSEFNFSTSVGLGKQQLEVLAISYLQSAAAKVGSRSPFPAFLLGLQNSRAPEERSAPVGAREALPKCPPVIEDTKPGTNNEEARADPHVGGTKGASIY